MTGTKWTLVPAQKQPVLIERGRIALFLVVMESYTIDYVNVRTVAESSTVSSKWEKVKKKKDFLEERESRCTLDFSKQTTSRC